MKVNNFSAPADPPEEDDTLDAILNNLSVYVFIQSIAHIILLMHRVNYLIEQYLHFSGIHIS